MSTDRKMYFTKDGKYFGCWAFTSHTTLGRVIQPIFERHPDIFTGEPFQDFDGFEIFQVDTSEQTVDRLESLKWEYHDDIWHHFFKELRKGVKVARQNNANLFLGI